MQRWQNVVAFLEKQDQNTKKSNPSVFFPETAHSQSHIEAKKEAADLLAPPSETGLHSQQRTCDAQRQGETG